MRKLIFFLFLLTASTTVVSAQQYDLVLQGGRVMDPETGMDAVRNVGIRDGKIVSISSEPLNGRRVIQASGLVVAPGFIDLHQHAQDLASQRAKALDGVTTALELEIGAPDVAKFLAGKQGHSLIHYGTSASQVAARSFAFGVPLPEGAILPQSGPATDQPATPAQIEAMRNRLRAELDAGGLAIGMGIAYTPGATRLEVIDVFRLAAERRVPVYTHVRSSGRVEPGSSIESISEVIGAAAITGASLHIVHINSSCASDSLECLSMVEGARSRGLDVTTEAYPYIAGMTAINSAVFNPGWQERLGISYDSLMIPDTGEHLTKARFDALHASSAIQFVIVFGNTQEVIDKVIPNPLVMIAQRWPRRASPERRNLFPRPRPIRPREGNNHADGCAAKDVPDAVRDAGAFHSSGSSKGQIAGRRRRGHRRIRSCNDHRPLHVRKAHGTERRRALFSGGWNRSCRRKEKSCRMSSPAVRCWDQESAQHRKTRTFYPPSRNGYPACWRPHPDCRQNKKITHPFHRLPKLTALQSKIDPLLCPCADRQRNPGAQETGDMATLVQNTLEPATDFLPLNGTGQRDRASYVLEQGKIRLVFTTALRSDSEIARPVGLLHIDHIVGKGNFKALFKAIERE